VRMRPFNRKEKEENRGGIVEMDMELNQVAIKNPDHPDAPPKTFTFDSVYDGNTQQRAFYEESCFGLVENVLVGFNGTIFAYGQTGCGKTLIYRSDHVIIIILKEKLGQCKDQTTLLN
jgi:kinesin family member 3B